MKDTFKIDDNYTTEENVKLYVDYTNQPKKIKSHLTNFIVYDLEKHNNDRMRPCVFCYYRLSKLAGRYKCDITPYEIQKCKKDTIAFDA